MTTPLSSRAGAVLDELRRLSAGLSRPPWAAGHPTASTEGVRLLPPSPAAADIDALARCFRVIYASSEQAQDGAAIWGEGWRCRWCGAEHGAEVEPPCTSCGGREQADLNDLEEVRADLARFLKPRPEWHPVACLLERDGATVGFAFGVVTTPRRAVAHLEEKLREYLPELAARGVDLARVDLRWALPGGSPVFYLDELCIEAGARSGLASLQGLLSALLAEAADLGARGLVGFTSKRAAPFRLLEAGGGEVRIDLGDLVAFRFEDFLPIATLCHHLSPEALSGVLAAATLRNDP